MIQLPDDIKIYFYKTINGDVSPKDFEFWLYADKRLESLLGEDKYIDLISINYNGKGAKYELRDLLEKFVNLGDYQTCKLLELLTEAKQKNKKLPEILVQFYDLYCAGYGFLRYIGLHYGLAIEILIPVYGVRKW